MLERIGGKSPLANIYYDNTVMGLMHESFSSWFRVYHSNWRVLHIDGFEGIPRQLPRATGRLIKIFEYMEGTIVPRSIVEQVYPRGVVEDARGI